MVLQGETCLLSVRCLLGVVGLVLLGDRVLVRSRGKGCAVCCWCTNLSDMFGFTLMDSITSVLSGTLLDSCIQSRSSILVQSCVSLCRANVVL